MKTYIYTSKDDNRKRCVVVDDNGNHTSISYPRILMAQKLGRPLKPNEDVHHIDEDVTNNDISNLEVRIHGEHQKEHSTKYVDTTETCMICGCKFTMKGAKWARFYVDLTRGRKRILTCSKSCAGKAGSINYPFLYKIEDRLQEVEQFWKK